MAKGRARREPTPGGGWIIGLGASIAALLLATGLISYDSFKSPRAPGGGAAGELERGGGADAAALRVIRREFPAEYEALRADLELDAKNGVSQAQREEALASEIHWFVADHAEQAASAPDADLARFADTYAVALERLAAVDWEACGRIDRRLSQARLASNRNMTDFLAEATVAHLMAAKAGAASPIGRRGPDEADLAALSDSMKRAGASDAMIVAVMQSGLQGLPESDRCRGSLAVYRGVADLPEEQSARWAARLLRSGTEYVIGRTPADAAKRIDAYRAAPGPVPPVVVLDDAQLQELVAQARQGRQR